MLAWCCPVAPRLQWMMGRFTNCAPVICSTSLPGRRDTIAGWLVMNLTSPCTSWAPPTMPTNSFVRDLLVVLERIRKRLKIRFRNHALVIVTEKFLQAVGIHGVLTGHIGNSIRRNRRDFRGPQKLENSTHAPQSRHTQQLGMSQFYALLEGQRIATSGNVQNRQPLRFRFALQYPHDESGHVVDVDKLNLVVRFFLGKGEHAGKSFRRLAHTSGPRPLAVGRSPEGSHQIIFNCGSRKNVRAENENSAAA